MLFELLPRGKKRISLIANIFFFLLSFSIPVSASRRRRVAEKDSPPFHLSSPLLLAKEERGKRKKERGKTLGKSRVKKKKKKKERKKEKRMKKKIRIFDETEEESSYVSLSDCQASTLMRRGVISETVYWLDPSRAGGSLSTSSRSLIPPPPLRFATPRILNPFHDFLPAVKKEPRLADTSWKFTTFHPCSFARKKIA